MKIKEYKKQLNESIEVIDIHDKIKDKAKENLVNTKHVPQKKRISGRTIAILASSFVIVIAIGIMIIPLTLSNSKKSYESMPLDTNYSQSDEKERTLAPEKTGNQAPVSEPTEASAYSPVEPGKSEKNDEDVYNLYSQSGDSCFEYSEFLSIYGRLKNGETVSDIINSGSYTEEEIKDIEIINNLIG